MRRFIRVSRSSYQKRADTMTNSLKSKHYCHSFLEKRSAILSKLKLLRNIFILRHWQPKTKFLNSVASIQLSLVTIWPISVWLQYPWRMWIFKGHYQHSSEHRRKGLMVLSPIFKTEFLEFMDETFYLNQLFFDSTILLKLFQILKKEQKFQNHKNQIEMHLLIILLIINL